MIIEANYFNTLEGFLKNSTSGNYLLLVASNSNIDLNMINKKLFNIYGAFFPQIIYNDSVYEKGLIAIKINSNMKALLINDMNDTNFLKKQDFSNIKSLLTIVEGFSNSKEKFLEELYQKIDINTSIIGGGAGIYEDNTKAVVFDNENFYKNGAIIVTLKSSMVLSVKHGWEILEGPFIVTDSCENSLNKIDHKGALEVYKEVIKKDCGLIIDKNNFSEISKNYPIGIMKYRKEQIVRDPISFENSSLKLVGKICNNSVINILKGENESLLKASREAASEVLENECNFVMMFDCITRKNFLEDHFDEELDTIYKKSSADTFIGAITIGEIANKGNKYINFLNKTCVIGGVCF